MTTKLNLDKLRTVFALNSADVEVERRNGKWIVVKEGTELQAVKSDRPRTWSDLDRCVETLEEIGAKQITIRVTAGV